MFNRNRSHKPTEYGFMRKNVEIVSNFPMIDIVLSDIKTRILILNLNFNVLKMLNREIFE